MRRSRGYRGHEGTADLNGADADRGCVHELRGATRLDNRLGWCVKGLNDGIRCQLTTLGKNMEFEETDTESNGEEAEEDTKPN